MCAMTAPLATRVSSADAAAIADAARCLAAGGLVAFPTETVYGLGADATNGQAVARLYDAKGRPAFNPLIAHVADLAAAQALARFDADAARLAAAFWPGPLTLVLPKAAGCPVAELATAGLDTIAVRVPGHAVAQEILRHSASRWWRRRPTAPATSRRPRRRTCSPICAAASISSSTAARRRSASNSTIVACLGEPALLRPGGVPREAIERALGRPLADPPAGLAAADDAPLAPGMLASHYAPRTPLRLDARRVEAGEALLAFGPKLGRRRRARGVAFSTSRRAAISSRLRPTCSRTCARSTPRRGRHRGDAGPARGPRRSDQRPARARRGAQRTMTLVRR